MRSRRLLTGLLAVVLSFITGGATAQPKRKGKKSPASTPALATRAKTRGQQKVRTEEDQPATQQARLRRAKRKSARAKPEPDSYPPMKLEAVNGGERATLRLYDRRGRTVKPTVRKIWALMKCHLTGKQRPIHWRLIRSMYRISRRYPGKTIYIYSGFRARRVASLPNSNHVKGRALDLRVEGVSNKALRDFLMATFRPSGIGYYPNGPFVHFDVREKQSAFWVDTSGKGEAAEYAANPYDVLRAEREARKAKAEARTAKTARPRRPSLSRTDDAQPASRPTDPPAKKAAEEKATKATSSKGAGDGQSESEGAKDGPERVSNTEEEGPTAEAAPRPKDDGAAQ